MKLKAKILAKIVVIVFMIAGVASFGTKSADVNASAKIQQGVLVKTSQLKVDKIIASPKSNNSSETITSNNEIKATRGINSSSSEVINYAYSFLGKPYVYGANGPNSFDCSGFTSYVFRHFGVNIPRTSKEQFGSGILVSKSKLKAGDLVFFNTYNNLGHVGIYIGNGDFIHAASSGNVKVSSLSDGYYNNKYVGARRLL